MIRDVPTDAAAHAVARPPAVLRELHHAWLLEGVGERVGQVRMYARGEVGLIAVALLLNGCGMKMGAAFSIARKHARQIFDAATQNSSSATLLVRIDSKSRDGYATSVAVPDGIGSEATGNAQAIIGLNLKRIVDDALMRIPDNSRRTTKAA